MRTRLAGFLCPSGSAHNRYFTESVKASFAGAFNPSPELLAEMDREQAAHEDGTLAEYWAAKGIEVCDA